MTFSSAVRRLAALALLLGLIWLCWTGVLPSILESVALALRRMLP